MGVVLTSYSLNESSYIFTLYVFFCFVFFEVLFYSCWVTGVHHFHSWTGDSEVRLQWIGHFDDWEAQLLMAENFIRFWRSWAVQARSTAVGIKNLSSSHRLAPTTIFTHLFHRWCVFVVCSPASFILSLVLFPSLSTLFHRLPMIVSTNVFWPLRQIGALGFSSFSDETQLVKHSAESHLSIPSKKKKKKKMKKVDGIGSVVLVIVICGSSMPFVIVFLNVFAICTSWYSWLTQSLFVCFLSLFHFTTTRFFSFHSYSFPTWKKIGQAFQDLTANVNDPKKKRNNHLSIQLELCNPV